MPSARAVRRSVTLVSLAYARSHDIHDGRTLLAPLERNPDLAEHRTPACRIAGYPLSRVFDLGRHEHPFIGRALRQVIFFVYGASRARRPPRRRAGP